MKYISIIVIMGIFGFFSKKCISGENIMDKPEVIPTVLNPSPVPYATQLETFRSLGYEFDPEVTKDFILRSVSEMTWDESTELYIENHPYSVLYYIYGWRDPGIKNYNYTDKCLWFDLDFFDSNIQYKWFMERLGAITDGELSFTDILIETDSENWEWISFKVNGKQKKWKLEKAGYVADHFVQRFSYLTEEFQTSGRYT